MKSDVRNILLAVMLIFCLYVSTAGTITAAGPTVIDIEYDPQNPTTGSTVTFRATVSGEDITAVNIIVQECNEQICFLKHNISMNEVGTLEYQADAELTRNDATIVKYNLEIESNGVWYDFKGDIKQFDLAPKTDGNQTNGSTNGAPGFEVIPLIIAIFVGVLLLKRKRSR